MDHTTAVKRLRACTDHTYNCAQALLVAFADVCCLTQEQAEALGADFGSGMMCGETCGTLTGAYMIAGLSGLDRRAVQNIRKRFLAAHKSTQCRELLNCAARDHIPRKEHCDNLILEVCSALDEAFEHSKNYGSDTSPS